LACVGVHAWGKKLSVPKWLGWAMTMFLVCSAWLAFYETRADVMLHKYHLLLTASAYDLGLFVNYLKELGAGAFIVLAVLLMSCAAIVFLEWMSWRKYGEAYALFRHPWASVLLIVLTVWLAASQSNEFIYFSF
jgi:alginate O-acetyltransferase complex protein AlgI